MALRIDSKIVRGSVVQAAPAPVPTSNVVQMHEYFERPDKIEGVTIKIKNQLVEHAIYMTVNHVVLNKGTSHEVVRPFEVFLNTKDAYSSAYFATITRLLSAVFRKGGDFTFILEELKSVHDARGGTYLPGGVFVNSVMHHIALELESHFQNIGAIKLPEIVEEIKAQLDQKRVAAEASGALSQAALCPKCHAKALIKMDGCDTCLECGHSKCN